MQFRRSRLLPFLHVVCLLFVFSYILFDVLDLDGSNLSAVATPAERAVIAAETPADIESPHRLAPADSWETDTVAPDQTARWAQPRRSDDLFFTPLLSARAHGYRVGLPRDAIPA